MGHSGGHICQCLGRLWSLRRSSVVTVSEERPGRTGGRFVEDVLGLAKGLSEHGLRGGDVVAVAALNRFSDITPYKLSHIHSFNEARFAMEMVRPMMLVLDEHCSPWSRKVVRECGIQSLRAHVFMGNPSFEATYDSNYISMDSLRRPSQGLPEFEYRWAPEDIALICFTSGVPLNVGTTGKPKGVCISHTALIVQSLAKIAIVGYGADDKEWKGGRSVKKVLNGGGGLSTELTNGATQLFPNAKLLSAYGKPAPHIELRICIEDEINHPTWIGKIQTRGPHVLVGYWGSTSVSEKQSWFDTGDVGWLDDSGGLWLVGRGKDRIKTGGENVYPEEVEVVLCQHPGVVSAVVIGLPDTRLSEAIVACVRIRENWRWMDSDSHRTKENERRTISGLVLRKHCRTKSLTGNTAIEDQFVEPKTIRMD
ncbi:hypothetical protein QJS10_CPA09g00731 [Acorus calamus]|uniref:AMP-dependent synthetase/ligase domain-containing protein n=1 Tax=Acorus calamus TaxID=4465 RepID=A0AAV9E5K8_ACOCL|nr:hypothetical protein QJS10_CPA09g00731 [Acorus calamus]